MIKACHVIFVERDAANKFYVSFKVYFNDLRNDIAYIIIGSDINNSWGYAMGFMVRHHQMPAPKTSSELIIVNTSTNHISNILPTSPATNIDAARFYDQASKVIDRIYSGYIPSRYKIFYLNEENEWTDNRSNEIAESDIEIAKQTLGDHSNILVDWL